MSNYTDFFPAGSSGGGGGGPLKMAKFTSSGSFDPSAASLSIGDWVSVITVGGGGGGVGVSSSAYDQINSKGGDGGQYKSETFQLTATTAIAVTIGGGGASQANYSSFLQGTAGNDTSVIGAGVSLTSTGGAGGTWANAGNQNVGPLSVGPHFGAMMYLPTQNDTRADSTSSAAGPGVNGFGAGGGTRCSRQYYGGNAAGALGGSGSNPGTGGASGESRNAGTTGIAFIYY